MMKSSNKQYRVMVIYVIFIIAIILLINSGRTVNLRSYLNIRIPFLDKIGHFVGMGLLTYVLLDAFSKKWRTSINYRTVSIIVLSAAMVTIEEYSQIFIAARSFSYHDLIADYLGILLFSSFFLIHARLSMFKRRQKQIYYVEYRKNTSA